MMKVTDVTVPLSSDAPVYPGDTPFERVMTRCDSPAGVVVSSRIIMSVHAGTHVDAPRHFYPEGVSVDHIPLEILMGKARVVEMLGSSAIELSGLSRLDLRNDIRLLIRTHASGRSTRRAVADDHTFLRPDAARHIARAGIKLLGIDSISVDPLDSADLPAHRELLSAGVAIVEGLDLSSVEPGECEILCLPLAIRDGEAAPARVVLRSRL
jgi:arylformamidase